MTRPGTFLIVGNDPYLVSEELHKLLEDAAPLAVDEFDSEDDPAAILQALATPALLADARTVLLRGVDAMTAEVQKLLTEHLENPVSEALLIMTAGRPVPRLVAAVRKAGRVIEAAKGPRTELLNWVARESKARALRLTGDAIGALVESVGESTGALAGALDELALAHAAGARLGKPEIARQFLHRPEAKLFGFVDSVAERRRAEALEALGRLIAQGEGPQLLLWNLHRHFRMMLASHGDSPVSAARHLGIPPWRAEKIVRQARKFSQTELTRAYLEIAEADWTMKKSEEPEALTLERTVVAICEGMNG